MDNSRSAGVSGSTPNSARPVQVDYTPRYLNTMIGADIQLDIDDDGYADLRAIEARTALVDGYGAEYCAIDAREETPGSIFWFLQTDCTASLGWFHWG
jgi:hypothetical protein